MYYINFESATTSLWLGLFSTLDSGTSFDKPEIKLLQDSYRSLTTCEMFDRIWKVLYHNFVLASWVRKREKDILDASWFFHQKMFKLSVCGSKNVPLHFKLSSVGVNWSFDHALYFIHSNKRLGLFVVWCVGSKLSLPPRKQPLVVSTCQVFTLMWFLM